MPDSERSDPLLSIRREIELAKRLAQCPSVQKFDDPGQPEGPAIADALGDLEKVFRKYLDELLPRILAASTCEALEGAIDEVRFEFQEVVWHLWYPKYFRAYLLGPDRRPDWLNTSLRP